MRLATWNVNSVTARLPRLLDWLDGTKPDVLCLQEIKVAEAAFPTAEVGELGYQAAVYGTGRWNGVAILSRTGLDDVRRGFPGALAVLGVAEHIPLRGGVVDAVVVGQAFHWFDADRALAEIARVLRPGGAFILADSPVYADTLARHRAWQRTQRYYAQSGTPELASRYRGLTRTELDGCAQFRFVTLSPGFASWRALLGRGEGARLPVLLGLRC